MSEVVTPTTLVGGTVKASSKCRSVAPWRISMTIGKRGFVPRVGAALKVSDKRHSSDNRSFWPR